MAEINANDNRKAKAGSARVKKLGTRVDMTPMVDLGFLLITFFIFTTTMSQPTSMNLVMPKEGGPDMPIPESGALTVLAHQNNAVHFYEGRFDPANVRTASLLELRKLLVDKKRQTAEKKLYVVIKPSQKADYGHIVDVLDEMKISGVKRYALVDITPREEKLIQ